MSDKEALLNYRIAAVEETLADAKVLLDNHGSPRTVINRAYYASFYAVLALFIAEDVLVKTSKHAGIIALFDREMVHGGKLPVDSSRMLHRLFEARQEADYRELVIYSSDQAAEFYRMAEQFLAMVNQFLVTRYERSVQK